MRSVEKPAASRRTVEGSDERSGSWVYGLLAVLLLPVSVALTDPPFIGDSFDYCLDIARVLQHTQPPSTLWEAGHILWRPLGYVLSPVFRASVPDLVAWTPALKIGYGLLLLNLLCGMLSAFLIFDLCRRRMGSPRAAMIPVCLFVWGDAVLAYSQSSTSYPVGFLFLMIGLWWQLDSRPPRFGPPILFGLAALFWLPYVVAIPAACFTAKLLGRSEDVRDGVTWSRILEAFVISGAVITVGVGLSSILAGVRSLPQFAAWLVSSGHGMHQTRQGIRAITGSARLFLDLGNDNVYMKRFLFHDPYHPVNALGALARSLGKPICFYLFLAAALLPAWFRASGRRALVLLAMAALPALFAAIFVFEPSSPERLLPVLPFLLLTLATGWNSPWRFTRPARLVVLVFALLLPVVNAFTFVDAFSGWRKHVAAEVEEFRANASPNDAFLGIVPAEALLHLPTDHRFDSLNRPDYIDGVSAVNLMDVNAQRWPSRVAKFVLGNWERGKAVWTEKAALSDTPPEQLLWVEGDNPTVHWRDINSFFRKLEFDKASARFLRIARTPANERLFRDLAN